MESFSHFRIFNSMKHSNKRSAYFNEEILTDQNKLVNYFEINFLNRTCQSRMLRITSSGYKGVVDIDEVVLNRFDVMSEFMYDENQVSSTQNEYESKKEHHEINLRIYKFVNACKLMTVYASSLTKSTIIEEADNIIKKFYYKMIDRYKVHDILDEIIMYRDNIASADRDKITPDYDFSEEKEEALFKTILQMNSYNVVNCILKHNIGWKYHTILSRIAEQKIKTSGKFASLDLIKNTLLELSYINIPLDIKNKIARSLNEIINDDYFEDENNYFRLGSALVYSNNKRPIAKCQELLDKYKDTHSYKGVVYHGFTDKTGYGRDIKSILKDYEDGFISCSKDLKVARNFAMVDEDYGGSVYSGVIEILIDENVEHVDIERILKEQYEKSDKLYETLYNYYINEKEVMVKMPIMSYNILSTNEVAKRLGEIKDNKEDKRWQNYNQNQITTTPIQEL